MKYLAYFRPNKELSDLILRQNHIVLPGSGLHSTICVLYSESEQEESLIFDLSKIRFNPFEIETLEFNDFDKDSLVLRLSRPYELLQLHKAVVAVFRDHGDLKFDITTSRYFEDNYNPHLTISKSSSIFDRTSRVLLGQKDVITKYSLSKKVGGIWKEVENFYSGK